MTDQILAVLPPELSEDEAWEEVKDSYAPLLQHMGLTDTWTVAPRRGRGGWRIVLYREEGETG